MYRACIDELQKLGAVDPAQAQAALENIDQLERNKTTPEQALRYGGFGAGMGIAAGGVTDMIRGKKLNELYEGLPGVKGGKLRNIAALGAGGAIAGGALPLLRQHMDRHIEMGKLRQFMEENRPQHAPEPDDGKIVGPTHGAGMTVTASLKEKDATFTESQYSGGTGGPPFVLVSGLANKAPPRLDAPLGLESELRKKGEAKLAFMGQKGSTPGGHLSSGSVQAGPKITAASGPSIGDIAKPKDPKIQRFAGVTMPKVPGWGRKIPGAVK